MTVASVESRVFCEGPHDRDFLRGYLLANGWADAPQDRDPDGKPVKGEFQFYFARAGRHLRIKPANDDVKVFQSVRVARVAKPTWVDRVIACVDSDEPHDAPEPLKRRLSQFAGVADGADGLELVVWHTASRVAAPGIPGKHTLERIVCAALAAAYPERADAVAAYVAGNESPKAWSWAHMARWYPEQGCTAFFAALWGDKDVARELVRILDESGARAVLERL